MHTLWSQWTSGLQHQNISYREIICIANSGTTDYSSIRVFRVASPRIPDPELQLFSVEDEAPCNYHEGVIFFGKGEPKFLQRMIHFELIFLYEYNCISNKNFLYY